LSLLAAISFSMNRRTMVPPRTTRAQRDNASLENRLAVHTAKQ
jgi:hypothetical protein